MGDDSATPVRGYPRVVRGPDRRVCQVGSVRHGDRRRGSHDRRRTPHAPPVAGPGLAAHVWRMALPRHGWLPFLLTGVLYIVPAYFLSEHWLRPFDRVLGYETDALVYSPGDTVVITWRIHVSRRVPARWRGHWLSAGGRIEGQVISGPRTGQIGDITLVMSRRLPVDAEPGRWCWHATATLIYNILSTVERPYPPVCVEVR